MKAHVSWQEKRTFEATSGSGHKFTFGSPAEGEEAPGPRPMELLLIGTAGCSAYDVVGILEKSRQDFDNVEVEISGTRADETPAVFTDIHLHFTVTGRNIDPKRVERAIELSVDKYCSASKMMSATANITYDYKLIDAG